MSEGSPIHRRLNRLRACGRRFRQDRDGATAVEFALVALPFLALLFGIIELAMIFLVSTSLDNATATAARTIRTGQLQGAGGATSTSFRNSICTNLGWLSSTCGANLNVDVRTYNNFNDIVLTDPVVNQTINVGSLTFQPGGPEDIVVVRAYYQWALFTPLLSMAVQKLSGGKALLTSTLTFRNEPYS